MLESAHRSSPLTKVKVITNNISTPPLKVGRIKCHKLPQTGKLTADHSIVWMPYWLRAPYVQLVTPSDIWSDNVNNNAVLKPPVSPGYATVDFCFDRQKGSEPNIQLLDFNDCWWQLNVWQCHHLLEPAIIIYYKIQLVWPQMTSKWPSMIVAMQGRQSVHKNEILTNVWLLPAASAGP